MNTASEATLSCLLISESGNRYFLGVLSNVWYEKKNGGDLKVDSWYFANTADPVLPIDIFENVPHNKNMSYVVHPCGTSATAVTLNQRL